MTPTPLVSAPDTPARRPASAWRIAPPFGARTLALLLLALVVLAAAGQRVEIGRMLALTGDGLLAALQILRIMREKERPLSELAGLLTPFPQKLINVRVEKRLPFEERPAIGEAVAQVEKELGGRGRVLLRYSGTEALCRVMVEGENADKVRQYAEDLAQVVASELR